MSPHHLYVSSVNLASPSWDEALPGTCPQLVLCWGAPGIFLQHHSWSCASFCLWIAQALLPSLRLAHKSYLGLLWGGLPLSPSPSDFSSLEGGRPLPTLLSSHPTASGFCLFHQSWGALAVSQSVCFWNSFLRGWKGALMYPHSLGRTKRGDKTKHGFRWRPWHWAPPPSWWPFEQTGPGFWGPALLLGLAVSTFTEASFQLKPGFLRGLWLLILLECPEVSRSVWRKALSHL